nr:MAG TPA: hypothetical protein [Caudoviricetes sp.]
MLELNKEGAELLTTNQTSSAPHGVLEGTSIL